MYDYTFIRKKRKTLTIKIDKTGKITVLAPLRYPKKQADAFVVKNSAWIEKKRAEAANRPVHEKITGRQGEKVPLFGAKREICLSRGKSVRVEGNILYLPEKSPIVALKKFYVEQLENTLMGYIKKYGLRMGVKPTKLTITSARTRWGSCSGKNALSFSFRLALCRPSAVEYVVVHELCHILHKNHSKAFWAEVEKNFPDFRLEKAYLKKNAYYMEII
jgi:hypothetical protein